MRFISLFILSTLSLLALSAAGQGSSCPPNIDFELGDFSNWECSIGTTSSTGLQNVITLSPSAPTTNRHEIISAATRPALDKFGLFPKLCPYGGAYSARLGNDSAGRQAEGLSYTFTVPTNVDTFTFTYFYAVVLQDPQHSLEEQPRFFVTAYEVSTGNVINCASYTYVSGSGLPGFKRSRIDTTVLYRDWSPTSLQFAGLGGRQVRLEFKSADCTLGAHFGYTYFDVGSGCSNILASAPYCIETNSLLLNAPYGFASYVWYNTNYTQVLGNQQNVTFSPPPTTTGVYHVDCIPYPGFGCRDTFNAVVTPLPVPDTPAAQIFYKICQNTIAPQLSATPSPGNLLVWYTTATGGIGSDNAPTPSTTAAGTFNYYVSQKVLFGCESFRRKITVQIVPTPFVNFNVNLNRQCQNNNQFIFTSANSNLLLPTYTWDFGDNTIIQTRVDTPLRHTYLNAGNFTVTLTVTNDTSCSKTAQQQITIIPKPIADFTYPAVVCQNQTQLAVMDRSVVPNGVSTINSWWWDFAGNISQIQNPNSYIPTQAGNINVKLVVKTTEGCLSDTTTQMITVRSQPKAAFTISDPLCENETIQFRDASTLPLITTGESINQWNWLFDMNLPFNVANPYFNLANGRHQIAYTVETNFGCRSLRLDSVIDVQPKPLISLSINDSCVFRNIRYQANDARNISTKWFWNFGTGFTTSTATLLTKYYTKKGNIPLILIGQTNVGCKDTLNRPFAIYDNIAFAGRDTLTAMWQPVQLNANGYPNTTYLWSPNIGLDSPNIEKPTATWDKDQMYTLYALTKEGCDKTSRILVKRFKGPEIYIPTAFTPNGDQRNDSLKVFPVGIKTFGHFTVFNRFGNVVFTTTDFTKGWDGKQNGKPADTGTYVAIVEAVDYLDKPMMKRELVLLIQ